MWEHLGDQLNNTKKDLRSLFQWKSRCSWALSGFLILGNGHQNVEAASFRTRDYHVQITVCWAFAEHFLRDRHTKIIKVHTLSLSCSKQCLKNYQGSRQSMRYEQISSTAVFDPLTPVLWIQPLRLLRFTQIFLVTVVSQSPRLILPATHTF